MLQKERDRPPFHSAAGQFRCAMAPPRFIAPPRRGGTYEPLARSSFLGGEIGAAWRNRLINYGVCRSHRGAVRLLRLAACAGDYPGVK